MKKSIKRIVTGAVIGATVCTSMIVGAVAGQKQEEIKAYMDYGITLKLNGQVKNLTDSSGKPTYPIRYKGTTYVPLRAVSELVGLPVEWDGTTETVLMGEKDKFTDFREIITGIKDLAWMYTENKDLLYSAGTTFNRGLVLKKGHNQYSMRELKFNTKCQYTKMGFTLATNSTIDRELVVRGDKDEILDVVLVKKGVQDVEFDVSGHNYVSLYIEKELDDKVVFGDIWLK